MVNVDWDHDLDEPMGMSGNRIGSPTPSADPAERVGEPARWLHTLYMEHGQITERVTHDGASPFGRPGEDYDPSYTVTSVPLYAPGTDPAIARLEAEKVEIEATSMRFAMDAGRELKARREEIENLRAQLATRDADIARAVEGERPAMVEAFRTWFFEHTGKRIFHSNARKAVDAILSYTLATLRSSPASQAEGERG